MNRTRTFVVLVGAVFAVAAGAAAASAGGSGSAGETASEAAFTATRVWTATVTSEQAVAAALARHAGTPTDVHLQDEGNGLRWEVKLDGGSTVWEVQIDARSGAVTSDQRDE